MADTRVLKLFNSGTSQVVRLSADFRFDGDKVYASAPAT